MKKQTKQEFTEEFLKLITIEMGLGYEDNLQLSTTLKDFEWLEINPRTNGTWVQEVACILNDWGYFASIPFNPDPHTRRDPTFEAAFEAAVKTIEACKTLGDVVDFLYSLYEKEEAKNTDCRLKTGKEI